MELPESSLSVNSLMVPVPFRYSFFFTPSFPPSPLSPSFSFLALIPTWSVALTCLAHHCLQSLGLRPLIIHP